MTVYAQAPKSRELALVAGLGLLALFVARAPLAWVVTGLGGLGLALAIAVRPALGLVALAFFIPLGSWLPLPVPGVNGTDILFLVTFAAWLGRGIARRAIWFRPPPLLWWLFALVWVSALSLIQASSGSEGVSELLKWGEFAGLYVLATQLLHRRSIWWVIGALFAAGLLQVFLGAYQFLGQVGPPAFILGGRFMRAYGAFRQPNPFAGYLGYLAPVAASLAVGVLGAWRHRRRRVDLGVGAMTGGIALALTAGIGMSWSRGGWIALAAALAGVVGLRSRRTAAIALLAGIGLAAVVLLSGVGWLPDAISGRLDDLSSYFVGPDPARTEITDANFAVLERLAHWQAGLRMFEDQPWLGVGIGNYAAAYARYALPHWYEALGHAHNVYINFLAETGVLGAGVFIALWVSALILMWRIAAKNRGHEAVLAIGVVGTLIYLSIHGLFDNLFVQHMQLQLALLLGCVVAYGRTEVNP